LKKESTRYINYVKNDPRLTTPEGREKSYFKRHCENRDRNMKLLMEWFLYEIDDWEKVISLYL